jgi:hypothetical protein
VGLAKVALLHDGGEGRHVRDGRFGRGGVVVLLEDLHVLRTRLRSSGTKSTEKKRVERGEEEGRTDLVEDALVVIFLEESLLAALFLLARLFRSLRVLLDAQFFRQGTARFDFLADLFEPVHPPTSRKERSATEKERSDKLDPTETRGRQDARVAGFSVSFETSQLAQFPRFKLAFGVEAIRVVHVGVNLLRLLCGNHF